jgi:hypothetical protein
MGAYKEIQIREWGLQGNINQRMGLTRTPGLRATKDEIISNLRCLRKILIFFTQLYTFLSSTMFLCTSAEMKQVSLSLSLRYLDVAGTEAWIYHRCVGGVRVPCLPAMLVVSLVSLYVHIFIKSYRFKKKKVNVYV